MTPEKPASDPLAMFAPNKDLEILRPLLQRLEHADPEKVDKLLEPGVLSKLLGEAVSSVAPETADEILAELRRTGPEMLRERAALFAGFEARLYQSWQGPLDLLEMLLVSAAEAAESFAQQWQWGASPDDDTVFDVVMRLHARGIEITGEILTLLKSGYASGAHARWRALHEVNVTAMFIAKHGKDVAQRYRLHEYIESHKAGLAYERYKDRLKLEPLAQAEIDELAAKRAELLTRYGKAFGGSYGWAADALQRADEGVAFADIERGIDLDHWRPYYKMASHPVHANPKTITFSLGRHPHASKDILLGGPSNVGLTDPGHGTAISLMQLTITLLFRRPSVDAIVVARLLIKLSDEIGDAFMAAKAALDDKILAFETSAPADRAELPSRTRVPALLLLAVEKVRAFGRRARSFLLGRRRR